MRPISLFLASLLLLGLPAASSAISVVGAAKWGLKAGAKLTLYVYEALTEPRSPALEQASSPSSGPAAPVIFSRGASSSATGASDGEPALTLVQPVLSRPSSSPEGPSAKKWSMTTLFDAVSSSDGNKYPTCWRRAVLELNGSCKELDGPTTQRLALELARCHLEEAGRSLPVSCDKASDPIGPCLKDLDQVSLVIYTEFFSYCSSVCFFVQSEIFQSQTEAVILALTQRTVEAVDLLYSSQAVQTQLVEQQRRSAEAQEEIRQISMDVKNGLEDSVDQMARLRDEYEQMGLLQSQALEQQRRINEELQRHAESLAAELTKEALRLRSMKDRMEHMLFGVWSTMVQGACAVVLLPILTVLLLCLRPYPQLLKALGLASVLLFVLWQFATGVWSLQDMIVSGLCSTFQGVWAIVNRVGIATIAFICISLLLPKTRMMPHGSADARNDATSNAGAARNEGGAEPGTAEPAAAAQPAGISFDQLVRLPRRELQRLAKQSGVAPANAKTADIIQALASAVSSSAGAP